MGRMDKKVEATIMDYIGFRVLGFKVLGLEAEGLRPWSFGSLYLGFAFRAGSGACP